jgi:hypothetical protein
MLFLSRSDPLVPKFPPFMLGVLEVVNSSTESLKCVCTRNEQESEALAQNRTNRIQRFGKPEGPVLSVPTVVRGTVGFGENVLLPFKWHLTRGRDKIHDNSRSCGSG